MAAASPLGECRLDGLIGLNIEPAALVLALCLQHHALGADDVLARHADEGPGVVVVRCLLAGARHQDPLMPGNQLICRLGM